MRGVNRQNRHLGRQPAHSVECGVTGCAHERLPSLNRALCQVHNPFQIGAWPKSSEKKVVGLTYIDDERNLALAQGLSGARIGLEVRHGEVRLGPAETLDAPMTLGQGGPRIRAGAMVAEQGGERAARMGLFLGFEPVPAAEQVC